MRKDWQYYEAHITIEPVFDEQLFKFSERCLDYGFQVSEFMLQKRLADTPERSKYDLFCTARDRSLEKIEIRMLSLLKDLRADGFKIWRYKIEDTIHDSRHEDLES